MPELSSSQGSSSSSLVDQALQSATTQLRAFVSDPAFTTKMNLAFGTDWDLNAANDFAQSWLSGNFSALPTIEIRSGAGINEANGAFAAQINRIYLSSDFLGNNAKNPDAVTAVLLEEIGHAIDFRINKTDAAGDEGDLFSRLVRGEAISANDLMQLKGENDHALISLNGHAIDIEMSQIAMTSFNGSLYQTHQGIDNKIYTRYSLNVDATSWSGWKESGGETYNAPAMAALNGRLYESHRGTNNLIYTRYSTNGADWSGWKATDGLAYNAPTLAAVNGKLYQAHRGTDNNIYLRYATNIDATTWSAWKQAGGQTYSAPALTSFQGKLYEAHRGTDNKIYTRYAINVDANTWSGWKAAGDATTENAPSMVEFKGNLYQSHRGFDNRIYTRSSRDGANWTDWNRAAGDTPDGFAIASDAPSMTVVGDRLYQAHQGNDNKIYTRSSIDGVNWSIWTEKGGETLAESQIIRFNETVNPSTNWNATVFIWDGNKGTAPPTDFYKNDPTNTTRIANLDLHSNIRADGKQGLKFDWGTGSPDGENQRLPNDYFAIRAYTVANFDGKEHTFRVKGDDGFQLLAKKVGTNDWTYITPENQWEQVNGYKEYKSSNLNGNYDLHFHYFERQGTSNFDLSWEKTGRQTTSGYFSQLTSLSANDWDRESGDDLRFDGKASNGESRSEIKQIYTDLSTAIFGSRKPMTAGYAFDPSYADYAKSPKGQKAYPGIKPYHSAIDIGASNGTSIKAATNGVVAVVTTKSYGGVVGVDETNDKGEKTGRRWWYVHNSSNSVIVGDRVTSGQTEIGKIGRGHLHLAVTDSSKKSDPANGNKPENVTSQTMSPLHAYWELRNSQNSTVNVTSPVLSGGIEYGSYKPNVTKEFLSKVSAISQSLSVPGEYLMAVMGFETGGSYSPSKKNGAGSGATGLIQFMPATAKGLGTSTQALAKMTAIQQLDYVEKYLKSHAGNLKTLEDVYMAVLYPKAIGEETSYTLFKKSDGKSYSQNKGLDLNGDGSITVGEATNKVRGYLPGTGLFA